MRENQELLDWLIEHIRDNGPVSTSSFDPPEGSQRAAAWAWYGNKPTNRALDVLWTNGQLMIDRREKFQRWYDLTERVHATWDDASLPSVEAERNVLGERALRAMGVTSTRWLPDYFRTDWGVRSIPGSGSRLILDNLIERGVATPARIRGLEGDFVPHRSVECPHPAQPNHVALTFRQPRLGSQANVWHLQLRVAAGSVHTG